MFPTPPFIVCLLLAISVAASPIVHRANPVTLPIGRQLGNAGARHFVQSHQNRAKHLISLVNAIENGHSSHIDPYLSTSLNNSAVLYTVNVGVGIPPTNYSIIVDTGSGNTWVGSQKPYVRTGASQKTNQNVSVSYGSGNFSGTEYFDAVSLSPELFIPRQSIGVASKSYGIPPFADGILGLSPQILTKHTLSPAINATIPTVTDNLYEQGSIPSNLVAISFEPTNSKFVVNGEITFGATDPNKFTGLLTRIPRTTTAPSKYFWGINQTIAYGSTTILSNSAGMVDTGTTLVRIATDAFERYKSVTGATFDNSTGLLKITPTQYSNLKPLDFIIEGRTFSLNANAQIWPRSLNTYIGGTADSIYLIVGDLHNLWGDGMSFVLGQVFLERFYSVYDSSDGSVSLATTPFTTATTN